MNYCDQMWFQVTFEEQKNKLNLLFWPKIYVEIQYKFYTI